MSNPSFIPVFSGDDACIRVWNDASSYPVHMTLHFFGNALSHAVTYACRDMRENGGFPYFLTCLKVDLLSSVSFGQQWGMDMLEQCTHNNLHLPGRGNTWHIVIRFLDDASLQRLREDRSAWLRRLRAAGVHVSDDMPYKPHIKIGDIKRADVRTVYRVLHSLQTVNSSIINDPPCVNIQAYDITIVGRSVAAFLFQGDNAHVRSNPWLVQWVYQGVNALKRVTC